MAILKCDIDDQFIVSVYTLAAESESGTSIAKNTLSIRLANKENVESSITTKTIPWPSEEPLPDKIEYNGSDGIITLLSSTTKADIPFRARLIRNLGKSIDAQAPKRFSAFSANPLPIPDGSTLISSLNAFSENDESEKLWKALKKECRSSVESTDLTGRITTSVQKSLIDGLRKRGKDTEFSVVCNVLRTHNIFGFRCLDDFFSLLLETDQESLVTSAIRTTSAFPESIYSKLLTLSAGNPSKSKGKRLLLAILERTFTEKFLVQSLTGVSTEHAAILIQWCTEIYQSTLCEKYHTNCLSLLGVLLDSHGHRLVWDDATHEKLLTAAGVLADMAALTDSFSMLETLRNVPESVKDTIKPILPPFSVRKIRLMPVSVPLMPVPMTE